MCACVCSCVYVCVNRCVILCICLCTCMYVEVDVSGADVSKHDVCVIIPQNNIM